MKDEPPAGAQRQPARKRVVELDLPELTPWEALALSYILDQLDTLIWARHGNEMDALLAAGETPDRPPDPDEDSQATTDHVNEPGDCDF